MTASKQWLDTYENENVMSPLYHLSSSTASTQPSWSDFEGNDDGHHIVAADSAVTAAAATITIVSSSISGSDDIEMTVSKIHKIWDRTDAMLNQQTFEVAVDEACVRYTCAEVVRMLDLSDVLFCRPHPTLCCCSLYDEIRETRMAS